MKNTLTGKLEPSLTQPAPSIECHLPTRERRNGMGLVIFPGGGYHGLAEHEGKGYAEYFSNAGIACFVVAYRLAPQGHKHPAMLEDALAAIGAVRARAGEWGIRPDRLGVIGSSAGGHLAAHALVAWDRYGHSRAVRPDFGILCYPVITMRDPFCHQGSRTNLLGPNPPEALMAEVSCEQRVSAQTPPCFIWHTRDDQTVPVENSLMMASALRAGNIPFELHVYHTGRHGLGLKAQYPWATDCLRWLKELK